MSRPVYETSQTLSLERRVANICEAVWGVSLVKLPARYEIDFAVLGRDDRVIGFVEVKGRNCTASQYPDFTVALSKAIAARRLSGVCSWQHVAVPVIIVVNYSDVPYYWHLTNHSDIRWGGRMDRFDGDDLEPLAVFDWGTRCKMEENPFAGNL